MVEQEWHRSRYQIELLKITMHIFKWAVEVCRCRRLCAGDDLSDEVDDYALAEIAEMEYRALMERAGTMPLS